MKNFILLTILLFSSGLLAQTKIHDQVLVQLSPNHTLEKLIDSRSATILSTKLISKRQNISLVHFENDQSADDFIRSMEKRPEVLFVKHNMESTLRYVPNDPQYSDQWNLEFIGAEEVWDITKGGQTFMGKEIVIAVIDEGFKNHFDLEDNLWENQGEIAGNGIDDDNNGYVDDRKGLNIETGNDIHKDHDHGTQVSSILGAKGDNNSGMTGLNFDLKIMLISEAKSIAEIIEAYEYVIDQRQKFNNSNGAEGAFVVVTNFSAGISNQFGSEWAIWCDLYDDLGEVGVLSVSAVPNSDINVDVVGDLPTTCESPFLITTTNTTALDALSSQAGFGSTHVDLGAPGEDVLVTEGNSDFRFGSGTSFACPHIAGAVGLLYSLPCPQLEEGIFANPQKLAEDVKRAIMESVVSLPSMQGKTVTGGRIDLAAATSTLQQVCDSSVGVIDLNVALSSDFVCIKYETPDFAEYTLDIIDMTGKLIYSQKVFPPLFGSKQIILNTTPQGISTGEFMPFLPSGIYVAMLYNKSNVITQKFYQN